MMKEWECTTYGHKTLSADKIACPECGGEMNEIAVRMGGIPRAQ